jgi:uncharacterized protein (DUF2147 family)
MKTLLLMLFVLISNAFTMLAIDADDVVGTWRTADGKGLIEIFKSGDSYNGKILGGEPRYDKNGKQITTDIYNPDPSKRSRPTIGLVIMTNFKFDGDDQWTGGNIYDPNEGKDYSCKMWMDGRNTLKIRGYVGISLFGRTEEWTRVK